MILSALFLFFLPGCRSLAPLEPVAPDVHDKIEQRCQAHFLTASWQFVQLVTAYTPDGAVQNAIGVTRIHPEEGRIKFIIMSLEGITLFKAKYGRKIEILKAVPPFDDEMFASTLFEEIRLIFFPPNALPVETGKTSAGEPVCRYKQDDDGFIEVLFKKDGQREIRHYSGRKKHLKTIAACYEPHCSRHISEAVEDIPAKISIHNHGFIQYRLELELIRAQRTDTD